MSEDRSCWSCVFRQAGGMTLLGFCKWFERAGKPAKEVPPELVDAGCKFWQWKPDKGDSDERGEKEEGGSGGECAAGVA